MTLPGEAKSWPPPYRCEVKIGVAVSGPQTHYSRPKFSGGGAVRMAWKAALTCMKMGCWGDHIQNTAPPKLVAASP